MKQHNTADNDGSGQQKCEQEVTQAGMQEDVTKNGDTDPAVRGIWSPFGMQDVLIKVLLAQAMMLWFQCHLICQCCHAA